MFLIYLSLYKRNMHASFIRFCVIICNVLIIQGYPDLWNDLDEASEP